MSNTKTRGCYYTIIFLLTFLKNINFLPCCILGYQKQLSFKNLDGLIVCFGRGIRKEAYGKRENFILNNTRMIWEDPVRGWGGIVFWWGFESNTFVFQSEFLEVNQIKLKYLINPTCAKQCTESLIIDCCMFGHLMTPPPILSVCGKWQILVCLSWAPCRLRKVKLKGFKAPNYTHSILSCMNNLMDSIEICA